MPPALWHPPSPVLPPIATLLDRLVADNRRRGHSGPWLFPGRLPGQPIAYRTLLKALRRLGFALTDARVTALRQLVQTSPAPVIAEALGFHHTTTTRQVRNVGATWNRYTAIPR